jgi:hypothetical protein
MENPAACRGVLFFSNYFVMTAFSRHDGKPSVLSKLTTVRGNAYIFP